MGSLILGEPDAKEKLKEETIEKIMSIAKKLGLLPTDDSGTIIGVFEDVNIDPIDNVLIVDDVIRAPKNFVDTSVSTDFGKDK